ncbi:PE domain-containing protein [Nocardia sp. NPDC052566]|uniref:PE domain-containing protein n=1 Tax=Nocardia sp. NPDC052566 TaxID=3364330 RepID=UPI0037CBF252
MSGHFEFDAVAAERAAQQLDGLVARLEQELHAAGPALAPPAAGDDEVSRRAAQTLNTVGAQYQQTLRAGVAEVRKLAGALRLQIGAVGGTESESAAAFGATHVVA